MAGKNYYLYLHDGKIKRETIRSFEIYPEFYALNRIPDGADIFAKIIGGKGIWQKHAAYPENFQEIGIEEKWNKDQKEYCSKFYSMLEKETEKQLLFRN